MTTIPLDGVPKKKQPVLVFNFWPLPQTKKVALQNTFRTEDPISKDNLSKTSTIRDELYNGLNSNSNTATMNACERYMPQLMGFVVSVEDNKNLRLNSPLSFSWSSTLLNKTAQFVCYTFKYEAVMGILCYAYAHINRAFETLASATDDSYDTPSKNAATLLRTAAGIFDYVNTRELPRWTDIPKEKPVELSPQILQAMSDYCCAAAQMVTLKKALLGGTTSPITMAKLAIDIWKKMEGVAATFKAHPEYKEMSTAWRGFITIAQHLSKAVAYKYLAMDAYKEEKYGIAVSYLNVAEATLKLVEVPQSGSALAKWKAEIEESKDDIMHIFRSYSNENNHIYFHKTIDPSGLEIPEAKNLMTPLAWMPPKPAYTSLQP